MHGVINLVYQFSLKLYKMTVTKQTAEMSPKIKAVNHQLTIKKLKSTQKTNATTRPVSSTPDM